MSPSSTSEIAWQLTRAISPRDRVRVSATDAAGTVLNQYSRTWTLDRLQPPSVPWAVHLATVDGFHLLAFDFDAKDGEPAAAADAASLSVLLDGIGVQHLVCRSGPTGGRHIWLAATEALDPLLIGTMARLLAALLPSLDIAPLRNATTGCVRPPGAPHRDGGHSEVLSGDVSCLRQPTTRRADIDSLVQLLSSQITGQAAARDSSAAGVVRIDAHGHPYLPGARRPMPAASLIALDTSTAGGDASAVLNTVLLGAVASRWHLRDIADLIDTAPGLEHLRSKRGTRMRSPRAPRDRAETLARQWRYAVRFIAEHPRRTGVDASFDTRAGQAADLVRTLQEHADASPGRWNRGGGPSDRRVLDCLHIWALTALDTALEADTRRIALTCGIGRETARTALLRLSNDGWIHRLKEAAGVHGATWNIDPQGVLPRHFDPSRAQAATRPEGAGAAERTVLLEQLDHRLQLARHDVFSGCHSLPLAAGNLYARLVSATPPLPHPSDTPLLHRLQQFGLLVHGPVGRWGTAGPGVLDGLAHHFGVAGRLTARQRRYQAERAAWSWWQAEHTWMCEPRTRRDRRAPADQQALWKPAGVTHYPKHPRGPDGRANFRAARTAVDDGALDILIFNAA